MRIAYFSTFALFTLFGIIICFENIAVPPAGMMIFFETISGTSMFFPLLNVWIIGCVAGFFLGAGIFSGGKKKSDADGDGDDF